MAEYDSRIDLLNDPTQATPKNNAGVNISIVSGGALTPNPIPIYYVIDDTNAGDPVISYVKSGS